MSVHWAAGMDSAFEISIPPPDRHKRKSRLKEVEKTKCTVKVSKTIFCKHILIDSIITTIIDAYLSHLSTCHKLSSLLQIWKNPHCTTIVLSIHTIEITHLNLSIILIDLIAGQANLQTPTAIKFHPQFFRIQHLHTNYFSSI